MQSCRVDFFGSLRELPLMNKQGECAKEHRDIGRGLRHLAPPGSPNCRAKRIGLPTTVGTDFQGRCR